MPELILLSLLTLWIYAPRWFFEPLQDNCEMWVRESSFQGVDDRYSKFFFRLLLKEANQLIRHALFLWRLWLGRIMACMMLCVVARWKLQTLGTGIDLVLVLLGASGVAGVSWALLQTLRMDALRHDMLLWARCTWSLDDGELPPTIGEKLRLIQEAEWATGEDQTEARRHCLETAWSEKVEALRGRQKQLEEWLPGLEIVAGLVLAATWLCTPVLNYAVSI